ncbi:ABC transporter ATP-binding protein [Flavivirga sp. 57AJ16]|uniref:ABC transporter ATP-binding protein n=1 Tax=Flavivirga sp. 57AJ16 TaxID=3025307 RepID=UPI00236673C7|nr:ATP-binding cassette domain-containing protein [Flavivirga sp. 57AJ16]MDD7884489.1 ATP-binding cassette domain-containing protein [Flavivirga sp. 57AJ16]
MVQTDNLTFHYKKKEYTFRFPNISLKNQENLLILGKSGIGKTTLLHLLAGLLKPVSGTIIINGAPINRLSHSHLDTFRGQNIGMVFQKNHAIRSLNVFDNLQARLFFGRKSISKPSIDDLLEQLDLSDFKKSKVNELSEGQLQRLGFALSVIHNPQVILADEPTSSLDDENCKMVMDLLINQAKRTHANLIVITHDHRIKPLFSKAITL